MSGFSTTKRMLLLVVLSSILTSGLSSSSDEVKVIDLQELLLNVSNSYRNFGHDIEELGSAITDNVRLIIQNMNTNSKLLNGNFNSEAKRSTAEAQLAIENSNVNAKESLKQIKDIDESLKENTNTLKSILEKLHHNIGTAQDCSEWYRRDQRVNRRYVITLPGMPEGIKVFCDMKTDGGGWTVFQRRGDFGNPKEYFAKNWIDYKNGFGKLEKEFWLVGCWCLLPFWTCHPIETRGRNTIVREIKDIKRNDHLFALTNQKDYELRVDLWDTEGNHSYAKYSTFKVDDERGLYRLNIHGYSGDAGDSMSTPKEMWNMNEAAFTTKDRENNKNPATKCGPMEVRGGGGWWHSPGCSLSNLNGLNLGGYTDTYTGILWDSWINSWNDPGKTYWYSLARADMKIRPKDFKVVTAL